MNKEPHNKSKNLALVIGNIMRWGVVISLSVTFIGGVVYLSDHPGEKVSYKVFTEQDHSVAEIFMGTWRGILDFKGEALIMMGILLLFSTPVIRVLFSLLGFIIEKDKLYIVITLIVLAIIFVSISGGLAH